MERKIAVQQYKIDYDCDDCKEGQMRPVGNVVEGTDPPQYPHVCNNCGEKEVNFEVMYPYSVMEEVDGERTNFLDKYEEDKEFKNIKVLKDDKIWEGFRQELMGMDEFKHIAEGDLDKERNIAIDWLKSHGKRKKNYKSFFKNWLRRGHPPKTGQKMVY